MHLNFKFCFFETDSVVILTHGFTKKTQKTPQHEIERAEDIKLSTLEKVAHALGKRLEVKIA